MNWESQARRISAAMKTLGYDAPEVGDHPERVWADKLVYCLEDLVRISNERDGCFLEIENGRSDAEGSEGAGKIYFKKDEGEGGK
jgi:hypothetical protein